ncbi:hypothetical protein Lal_00004878 [Lupinus albus]|nr:hypothetical protein Lal_00004878 [Lupinus albus]
MLYCTNETRCMLCCLMSQNRKVLITHIVTPTFFNAISALFATNCDERRTVFAICRKLKENGRGIRSNNYKGNMGSVTLDDYNPTNPRPDAKDYVRGGTIVHNQPIGPYKPKPMPPPPGDES